MGSLVQEGIDTPLVEELTGLAPFDAGRRLAGLPHLLFLDSAQQSSHGRYSYVTADPFQWLECPADEVRSQRPLAALQKKVRAWRLSTLPGLPPFQGGAAGLFGYGLRHEIERLPSAVHDEFRTPALAVGFYDWVLAFDHELHRAWLIATGLPESTTRGRQRRALRRLDEVRRRLDEEPHEFVPPACSPLMLAPATRPVPGLPTLLSNFSEEEYLTAVQRAINYVHAGDCFQVNLSQRLVTAQAEAPLAIYERLRERNPAPFAGYFDLGTYQIASASPERFMRMQDNEIETRPIKGTRRRGGPPMEDMALVEDLRQSAKDRAENVMIVDLLRNDLGRVCAYGSIRVPALCRVESFPYVHHLVSEVRGRLRPGLDGVDLLRATFPGGSVTGAPKIRAMEIITELEGVERGPYCGSLGFLGFDGSMDTNILIRTLVLGHGWIHFSVGGGIVADSDPRREYEETWHKARGLLRALES